MNKTKRKGRKRRLLLGLALVGLLAGCGSNSGEKQEAASGIQIVASLFPQYDFAREIVGEYGTVSLLLDPGMESHSFDPTTADMKEINGADLFLYTGPELETWVAQIEDSFSEDLRVVDLSENLMETLEAELHESETKAEQQTAEGESHQHAVDPHIWTNPVYAMDMVQTICDAVCDLDPEHADRYRANTEAYLAQLENLDKTIEEIVETGVRREVVHGGRFALYHFAKRYGLTFYAAYDSCEAQMEPSAKTVAELTKKVKEEGIPVVFYEELTEPKVARSICEETGAQLLLLHSCHNVSAEEFQQGVTYLDLMQQNAENLKKALN
jgi:zinc transport system substrate-binding protein